MILKFPANVKDRCAVLPKMKQGAVYSAVCRANSLLVADLHDHFADAPLTNPQEP